MFPAGSVIIREGEPGDSFFLIDQGVVEVSTQGAAVGEVPLTTLQRGAFFGEVSVLNGSARTATVTALTNVAAVAFDRPVVEELLAQNPRARRLLETIVAGRARDAAEKLSRASVRPGSSSPAVPAAGPLPPSTPRPGSSGRDE
jgi:CRP-like cAMP-binding protein